MQEGMGIGWMGSRGRWQKVERKPEATPSTATVIATVASQSISGSRQPVNGGAEADSSSATFA